MANTTWNPADKIAGVTLSAGNLTATGNGSGSQGVRGVHSQSAGKYYVEYTGTFGANESMIGFGASSADVAGNSLNNAAYYHKSGIIFVNGVGALTGLTGLSSGSLLCVALDLTARLIWFRVGAAGNWNGNASYNPATGTGGVSLTSIPSTLYPLGLVWYGDVATANFGDTAFTGAVPSGFTAGWPAPATITRGWNPADLSGFTLSGSNLVATATAQGGVRSVASVTSGKWYFEITVGASPVPGVNTGVGIANASAALGSVGPSPNNAAFLYKTSNVYINNSFAGADGNFTGVVGIALDMGAKLIWFRHSVSPTTWNGSTSNDPATGVGGYSVSSIAAGAIFAAVGSSASGEVFTANFGDSTFAMSAPSGFTAGFGPPTAITGTAAVTLSPATLAATGSGVPNSGRLAPFTFAPATLVASAVNRTGGQLSRTLDALVLNPPGTGAEKFGSLAATLAPLTLAGAGTHVSARLDAILAALTLASAGAVAKTGRLDRTLQTIALAGNGALANRGILDQTLGALTLAATNSARTFFMAWTTEGAGFGSSMLREDEQVFSFELVHEEADFPSLRLDCKNPKVGLLAAGRNQWTWFSWRDPASGEIVPLFHGRLIGIPEDLADEVVRLQFVARPSNYIEWKNIVAAGLKVRPFWDPVWIAEGDTDPDTVLEARPAAWHIDRVSLAVTASDTIVGEDGTLAITADDHFYDALKVSYGDTPLRRMDVTGTVTWTQGGSDFVDITQQLWDQFRFAGSPYEFPMVSSFTGDGLLNDWPKPDDGIGGGWSMDATSGFTVATWQQAWLKSIVYVSPVLSTEQEVITPGYYQWGGGWAGAGIMGWKPAVTRDREYVSAHETIATVFPLVPIANTFRVRWEASRSRTEIVKFAMTADTQPLLVDPSDDEMDKLDLSSDFVGQPIDPGGALPLGSLLRNSYFNTDRGNASVEYLIMLARAKMLSRARAVSLSVETPFGFATRLSCRQNATVFDPRLPGGQGTGKITRYALSVDGDSGEAKAEITLGCTVGRGNSVIPDPGTETYGEPDWSDDYQAMDGATLDAGTGDILYESFDGMEVLDDDGLDLMRMTPDRIIQSIVVTNGPDFQQNTLDEFYREYTPPGIEQKPPEMGMPVGSYVAPETPTEMLSKMPTTVELNLVPISNQSFETTWEPSVSGLMVPKTIDLEADYV